MGYGSWSDSAFRSYSKSRGRSVSARGIVDGDYSNQEIFKSHDLDPMLDPKNVTRECCDSDEHPNVVPVILALDVTGSMGQAAVEVAKKINVVMTELYKTMSDVQFLIMGIGDMACDTVPAQASQFESDIRIADQLEKIYFEFGGGGNGFESYTLAWYFALNHTKIDAIDKRNKKGIIITMGDEPINPYLPKRGGRASFDSVFGDIIEEDIDTNALYQEVSKKFECFHIHVNHNSSRSFYSFENCGPTFAKVMGDDRVICATLDDVADKITEVINNNAGKAAGTTSTGLKKENGVITW